MIDMSETLLRTRVLNLHMQNRFLFPISHDARNLTAYGGLSTVPGDLLIRSTRRMDFLRVFSKKPFGRTNAWVCHPHREVNISISVFVAAVEVTTKCSMQLMYQQHPSDMCRREGVTFCLCFATHEYMLTSTRVRIRVCSWTYMCARVCVCSRLYIN